MATRARARVEDVRVSVAVVLRVLVGGLRARAPRVAPLPALSAFARTECPPGSSKLLESRRSASSIRGAAMCSRHSCCGPLQLARREGSRGRGSRLIAMRNSSPPAEKVLSISGRLGRDLGPSCSDVKPVVRAKDEERPDFGERRRPGIWCQDTASGIVSKVGSVLQCVWLSYFVVSPPASLSNPVCIFRVFGSGLRGGCPRIPKSSGLESGITITPEHPRAMVLRSAVVCGVQHVVMPHARETRKCLRESGCVYASPKSVGDL